MTAKKKSPIQLNGVPDIRRFFYKNEIPLYFISATNFNLLGADEWIKGFGYPSNIGQVMIKYKIDEISNQRLTTF